MKRINILWVIASLSLFITGCSEDDLVKVNEVPAKTGDEIIFGASASFEDGNPQSRTVYGEKGNGYQIINWETGDMVRICCAQAAQEKEADYTVSDITDGSTSDLESSASTLNKVGENGLQWGTGEHTFYAVYPSPAYFQNPEPTQPQTTISGSTVTGRIPVNQIADRVSQNVEVNGETYDYVFYPNMDCAYMAARAVYDASTQGGNGVTLHFKPLVTAIEVELNIGQINPNEGGEHSLTLQSAALYSRTRQDLSGSFSADVSALNTDNSVISGVSITNTNEAEGNRSRVTLGWSSQTITLGQNAKCLMTFFIHPSATFSDNDNDLCLEIGYRCNGVYNTRRYTIGKEVQAHKKYFFNNITLPDITGAEASNWFSLLDEDILISQLSIPGAGNAASSGYRGGNSGWYREQTISLEEQWNLGVRCFEFVSDRARGVIVDNEDLTDEDLTCNSTSVGITFDEALTTLTDLLKASPRECLIIICSYQPGGTQRDNQDYMDDFTATYGRQNSVKDVDIVRLDGSSTVGDLRGKIAFIGRVAQEGEDENTTLTDVPSWFTYIQGWGSLKDKWNRRFGDGYYPAYGQDNGITGERTNVEDLLWSLEEPAFKNYPVSNPNFLYPVSGGGNAWVQEWMRVVPDAGVNYHVGGGWNTPDLYINWPGSYDEKYNNIVSTFERAKNETDNSVLYINSLCGYYVSEDVKISCYPYISGSFEFGGHDYGGLLTQFSTGGMGGDFATYNNEINADVYNYVLEQAQNNTTGPMGIVMMDYIGNGDAGTGLPGLILQNNFKFPLDTRSGGRSKYDASYENKGNAMGSCIVTGWDK